MAEDRSIGSSESVAGAGARTGDKKWSRQEAEHFQGELLKKGESLLGEQKGSLARVLNGIANVIDKSAAHFDEEGQPNTARYARQAAESVHGFARDLRERDVESLRRQVTELARRQPALVVGGAVALGFLASRFLRSSSEHAEHEYRGGEFEESEKSLVGGGEKEFGKPEEEFSI